MPADPALRGGQHGLEEALHSLSPGGLRAPRCGPLGPGALVGEHSSSRPLGIEWVPGQWGTGRGPQGLTGCVLCPAVAHRPGAFKAELSKLVIVAKAARSEL